MTSGTTRTGGRMLVNKNESLTYEIRYCVCEIGRQKALIHDKRQLDMKPDITSGELFGLRERIKSTVVDIAVKCRYCLGIGYATFKSRKLEEYHIEEHR